MAFAYGGIAQFIAGILEYKNGNAFGAVAFTFYGAFWCCYAFLLGTAGAGWITLPATNAVGLALLLWEVFSLLMWIATCRSNFELWTLFLLLWITFFLLAGGDLGTGSIWHAAGGWAGLLTGIDALYLSFAEVANAAFGSSVFPIGGPIIKQNPVPVAQAGKSTGSHPEGTVLPVGASQS